MRVTFDIPNETVCVFMNIMTNDDEKNVSYATSNAFNIEQLTSGDVITIKVHEEEKNG